MKKNGELMIIADERMLTCSKVDPSKVLAKLAKMEKKYSKKALFMHTGCIFRGAVSEERIADIERMIDEKEIY